MVGWHHWLHGHELEQTPGDTEGQGTLLVCCSPWDCKESSTTEWLNNKGETAVSQRGQKRKCGPGTGGSTHRGCRAGRGWEEASAAKASEPPGEWRTRILDGKRKNNTHDTYRGFTMCGYYPRHLHILSHLRVSTTGRGNHNHQEETSSEQGLPASVLQKCPTVRRKTRFQI